MTFQNELIKQLKSGADRGLQAIQSASKNLSYSELLVEANKVTTFLLNRGMENQSNRSKPS
ncbi:hypothetical protein LVD15_15155 [Fulvivirga maritima]|uniref:hypothetical protein n=1 Tax=Fulvivirga maritima TaxID=2904247 RepID=UPI001F3AF7A0|nr:hypothetical protein [Fulvivirga maritima]UII24653.1 hypothetical protein LVD15_15155 [Fulvivirga maritima]